jgi:hypothetical protein
MDSNWKLFCDRYSAQQPHAINYIVSAWLSYKEKFVRTYTDQHFHFGSRASSRAEGSHFLSRDTSILLDVTH